MDGHPPFILCEQVSMLVHDSLRTFRSFLVELFVIVGHANGCRVMQSRDVVGFGSARTEIC